MLWLTFNSSSIAWPKVLPALKDTEIRSLQIYLQEDQGDPEALLLCAISLYCKCRSFANKCRHVRHRFLKCGQEIKSCSSRFTRHLCSMLGTFRKWRLEDPHPVSTLSSFCKPWSHSPRSHGISGLSFWSECFGQHHCLRSWFFLFLLVIRLPQINCSTAASVHKFCRCHWYSQNNQSHSYLREG